MNDGLFGFDHELRTELALAAVKYLESEQHRAPLNEFIMDVQSALIDQYYSQKRQIEKLTEELRHTRIKLKNAEQE